MSGQTVAYVRVSTTDQHLDRQRAAVVEAVGEPDRWFEDEVSGRTTDRPGLAAVLAHLREGDRLVVTSMDRLGRSTLDCLRLVEGLTERGVVVRFLREGIIAGRQADPRGEFTLTVLAAVAQLERSMIRERQAEGIALAKQRGVYRGRARRLSREQVATARERVAAGVPVSRVAREASVSRSVLADALAQRGAYATDALGKPDGRAAGEQR